MTSLPMDPATPLRPPDWRSGLEDNAACSRFDPSVPYPARVYAYWLGGKDHHRADREAAEEVMRRRPQVVAGARANRAFLARVVRYLTGECGIRQFLDIGTGLPAQDNTHEVAQAIAPDCRVVYVDDDPVVLAHARALLTSSPRGSCDYVDSDLRDTSAVLAGASQTLDLGQPTAVLWLAVLHFIPDSDDPAGIVATMARQLAPGSYLAISHLTSDFAPGPVTAGVSTYNTLVPTALSPRSHSQVSALFAGLPLVPREWFRSPNGGPLLARSPTLPIFTRAWPTLLPPGPDPSRQALPPARAHCRLRDDEDG